MKTYYVTGLTGFVGYNFYLKIRSNDTKVIGLVMRGDRNLHLFKNEKNLVLVEGDLTNINDVTNFLSVPSEGDKYLVHIAGKVTTLKNGDDSIERINFFGTKNIVDISNNLNFKKFLYVSSVDAIYIDKKNKKPIAEPRYFDDSLIEGIYGKSKAKANNYVINNAKNYIIVMPSAIVGPNDPIGAPINKALEKVVNGKMKARVNGGYNIVDVRDVVDGMIAVLDSNITNRSYLFPGTRISIRDLLNRTADLSGVKKPFITVPHFVIKIISPFVAWSAKRKKKTPLFTGFAMDCLNDNPDFSMDRAVNELNYKVRNLDDSLKDTIKELQSRYN